MRKDVLAALSIIGVGSAIFFWASRNHSPVGSSVMSSSPGGAPPIENKTTALIGGQPDGSASKASGDKGSTSAVPVDSGGAGNKAGIGTGLNGQKSTAVSGLEKTEPAKKAPTCFLAEYQVPETDIPQILDLGKDLQLNSKTVCVRVNGSPVAFHFKEKAKNQIIIGSLHEPKNDVKVSYCVGVSKCSDPCVVKQDRFLAALGGEDDLKANGKEEGTLSAEEQDLEKELASFQALRLSKEQKVFSPKQVSPSCQKDAS